MQPQPRALRLLPLLVALGTAWACTPAAADDWGTYLKPFSADSLWNSRPVNPTFAEDVIPTSSYFPAITANAYSTGMFLASPQDPPMTITGASGSKGLFNTDDENYHDITIPHWPSATKPAPGSDGHADIVDPTTNIIHSFWQLKQQGTQWTAAQYSWTKLDGRGWPDPGHYYQGARATGVPASGGLIRIHEAAAKPDFYSHALAMSLTFNGLSANPTYVFPATSADTNAAKLNSGAFPEGALVMLPASFDTSTLTDPELRRIAETLKRYGAYIVDANTGTPFVIYVEIGASYNLHPNGWNNTAASELQVIRVALRRVTGASSWVDGNGKTFTPNKNLNLLSMRGSWTQQSGSTLGKYSSWDQAVVFPATSSVSEVVNYSNRGMNAVTWAKPVMGASYKVTARTTGGGKLRFTVYDQAAGKMTVDTGYLDNGQSKTFTWSATTPALVLYARSGGTGQASNVGGELIKAD
ncbi:MAG: hypothetical protein GAK35_02408 [Herbaspirillum frisingense]|uniref:Atrophin-1 multi-domain protein n=1 Tax=Herbaspirillum frisingense TaxID=92645 RepID=A0A7V8JTV4_9BURK|nr:MAG: hypothetical protein GAK35_02408 [Herbaspirillum frisingense]